MEALKVVGSRVVSKHINPAYPIRNESVFAAVLLAIALFDMPYGYYQFLRWMMMVIGILIALNEIAQRHRWLFYFGLSVAVLFNPFVKIGFERQIWWFIDLALSLVFIMLALFVRDKGKTSE